MSKMTHDVLEEHKQLLNKASKRDPHVPSPTLLIWHKLAENVSNFSFTTAVPILESASKHLRRQIRIDYVHREG